MATAGAGEAVAAAPAVALAADCLPAPLPDLAPDLGADLGAVSGVLSAEASFFAGGVFLAAPDLVGSVFRVLMASNNKNLTDKIREKLSKEPCEEKFYPD